MDMQVKEVNDTYFEITALYERLQNQTDMPKLKNVRRCNPQALLKREKVSRVTLQEEKVTPDGSKEFCSNNIESNLHTIKRGDKSSRYRINVDPVTGQISVQNSKEKSLLSNLPAGTYNSCGISADSEWSTLERDIHGNHGNRCQPTVVTRPILGVGSNRWLERPTGSSQNKNSSSDSTSVGSGAEKEAQGYRKSCPDEESKPPVDSVGVFRNVDDSYPTVAALNERLKSKTALPKLTKVQRSNSETSLTHDKFPGNKILPEETQILADTCKQHLVSNQGFNRQNDFCQVESRLYQTENRPCQIDVRSSSSEMLFCQKENRFPESMVDLVGNLESLEPKFLRRAEGTFNSRYQINVDPGSGQISIQTFKQNDPVSMISAVPPETFNLDRVSRGSEWCTSGQNIHNIDNSRERLPHNSHKDRNKKSSGDYKVQDSNTELYSREIDTCNSNTDVLSDIPSKLRRKNRSFFKRKQSDPSQGGSPGTCRDFAVDSQNIGKTEMGRRNHICEGTEGRPFEGATEDMPPSENVQNMDREWLMNCVHHGNQLDGARGKLEKGHLATCHDFEGNVDSDTDSLKSSASGISLRKDSKRHQKKNGKGELHVKHRQKRSKGIRSSKIIMKDARQHKKNTCSVRSLRISGISKCRFHILQKDHKTALSKTPKDGSTGRRNKKLTGNNKCITRTLSTRKRKKKGNRKKSNTNEKQTFKKLKTVTKQRLSSPHGKKNGLTAKVRNTEETAYRKTAESRSNRIICDTKSFCASARKRTTTKDTLQVIKLNLSCVSQSECDRTINEKRQIKNVKENLPKLVALDEGKNFDKPGEDLDKLFPLSCDKGWHKGGKSKLRSGRAIFDNSEESASGVALWDRIISEFMTV